MKYRVTATAFDRQEGVYVPLLNPDGTLVTRVEEIDTDTNPLFALCIHGYSVEDAYEQYWNRLRGKKKIDFTQSSYTNATIVKVLNVERIR